MPRSLQAFRKLHPLGQHKAPKVRGRSSSFASKQRCKRRQRFGAHLMTPKARTDNGTLMCIAGAKDDNAAANCSGASSGAAPKAPPKPPPLPARSAVAAAVKSMPVQVGSVIVLLSDRAHALKHGGQSKFVTDAESHVLIAPTGASCSSTRQCGAWSGCRRGEARQSCCWSKPGSLHLPAKR